MNDVVEAILDYQAVGGHLTAYKLEDLDNMEFFKYSLFMACRSAENKAQERAAENATKGVNVEQVRYAEEANAYFVH